MKDARAAVALLLLAAAPPSEQLILLRNATSTPLECQVLAAHWHSLPPQPLPASGSLAITLVGGEGDAWRVAADGPAVERLFCGPPGHAWADRAEIDLPALPQRAPVLHLVCRVLAAHLACLSSPAGN